ncbi:P2X purinoceptor 7-like [Cimex lectularius]|uniref:P2X purinoreceptor 7 intracellular domain-containing protein n=1 Tax=Cimex lectularius TaxID=79782 RepID=A0A8I6RQ02_CIMLE|nr:P2X purinoceptor 7-like [Cimex lectularius]
MDNVESDLSLGTPMANRNGNVASWCGCFECEERFPTPWRFCCRRNGEISFMRGEIHCITLHDSFQCVVTNLDTLSTARHIAVTTTDSEKYKSMIENRNNRVWRHFAYKQFVNWVNSWSPTKRIGIALPSCVVKKIREAFPDENGYYEEIEVTTISEFDYFD